MKIVIVYAVVIGIAGMLVRADEVISSVGILPATNDELHAPMKRQTRLPIYANIFSDCTYLNFLKSYRSELSTLCAEAAET